jgi:hypothetical protein
MVGLSMRLGKVFVMTVVSIKTTSRINELGQAKHLSTISELARQEYYNFIAQGMGISAIAKMLNIPRVVLDPRDNEGGLLTEKYVLEEIENRLQDPNSHLRASQQNPFIRKARMDLGE